MNRIRILVPARGLVKVQMLFTMHVICLIVACELAAMIVPISLLEQKGYFACSLRIYVIVSEMLVIFSQYLRCIIY